MRIGLGYDIHKTKEGNKIFIGGIEIPATYGILAHSDGDVVLHALMDALLGSLSLGDIGKLFPPWDIKYKNISSSLLLEKVLNIVNKKIIKILNINIIINLEKPKLVNYENKIKENIAKLLSIEPIKINISIKSGEGVGIIGKNEAISSQAIILLEENNA